MFPGMNKNFFPGMGGIPPYMQMMNNPYMRVMQMSVKYKK